MARYGKPLPDLPSAIPSPRVVIGGRTRFTWEPSARPSRRVPHIDQPRPGCELVPFVGGPWHCDLRAIPLPLRLTWNVPLPVMLTFESFVSDVPQALDYTSYALRRMNGRLPQWPEWRGFFVYVCGAGSDDEVREALTAAAEALWTPGEVD
jgi:hypothetical protein